VQQSVPRTPFANTADTPSTPPRPFITGAAAHRKCIDASHVFRTIDRARQDVGPHIAAGIDGIQPITSASTDPNRHERAWVRSYARMASSCDVHGSARCCEIFDDMRPQHGPPAPISTDSHAQLTDAVIASGCPRPRTSSIPSPIQSIQSCCSIAAMQGHDGPRHANGPDPSAQTWMLARTADLTAQESPMDASRRSSIGRGPSLLSLASFRTRHVGVKQEPHAARAGSGCSDSSPRRALA
jgi:hypothetical protein